jgi:2-keto-4-pentenoate hydratase/2-oxohepta-3-ene-1,7-dioic acid hydratase in catechol pathway
VKIAAFEDHGRRRHGLVVGQYLHPLPVDTSVLELIAAGASAADQEEVLRGCDEAVRWTDVRLLAPLEPRSIRDFVAFERHLEGMAKLRDGTVPPEWYEAPAFYFANPYAVVGHDEPVPSRRDARCSTSNWRSPRSSGGTGST